MSEFFMDQDDIKRLLNTIAEESEPEENRAGLIDITDAKVIKRFRKALFSVKGLYRSPVIKSEDIVYNPVPGLPVAGRKVVVRSLYQYAQAKHIT